MGPKVLGRITASMDRPRGPDVLLSLSVPEAWLAEGATLQIELPRNLACAACEGGGCDACGRSGAVSTRGRKEPAELVEVTLPRPTIPDEAPSSASRVVVMRIPDRGGLPSASVELPRGNLMLSVRSGTGEPRGVTRLAQPSLAPPPMDVVSTSEAPPAAARAPSRAFLWAIAAAALLFLLYRILR
ncbi:MAG TPA: hypothetical protein VHE30_19895 [Polyangiaceae bacterium]|nr:hypothetical protein [Polyangiaceae bacterium]